MTGNRKLFYGWIIVEVAVVATLVAAGIRSVPGSLLISVENDLGWSKGTISLAISIGLVLFGLGGPFSGYLTDRYGPRVLLSVYYSFRGLSLLLLPLAATPETMISFAILFGLDSIATVLPTVALVADNVGRQNVGTVHGWVFAAHQLGATSAAWAGGCWRLRAGCGLLSLCIGRALGPAGAETAR